MMIFYGFKSYSYESTDIPYCVIMMVVITILHGYDGYDTTYGLGWKVNQKD